jgi:hypothetical protein
MLPQHTGATLPLRLNFSCRVVIAPFGIFVNRALNACVILGVKIYALRITLRAGFYHSTLPVNSSLDYLVWTNFADYRYISLSYVYPVTYFFVWHHPMVLMPSCFVEILVNVSNHFVILICHLYSITSHTDGSDCECALVTCA